MNISAIPASAAASSGTSSKTQPSEASTPDVSFNKILTREVADRRAAENTHTPKTKDVGSTNKKNGSSGTASSSSAEDSKSSDSASTTETEENTSAEQLLMMAAQFSPAIPPAESSIAAQSAAASALLTAEAGNIINAAQSAASQRLGKPELVSIEQNAGATDSADLKPSEFDTTLSQLIEKNHGQDASIKNEKNPLTGALQQQDSAAAKIAEKLIPSISGQAAVDLAADKTPDTRPDLSATLAPLQQAIVSHAQASQGHSADRLTPHVGTPAWNQAVGQKLVWMIGGDQQSASLTLNPPDLGPLQVVLNVSSTQANASFYSSQPEVRQALEAALPKLREMLGDAGIQLGQANVSAGTPQQQGSYGGQQESSRGFSQTSDSPLLTTATVANSTRIIKDGLIDTFA